MPGCCATGCSNSDLKGFSMKRFPRDPEQRKLWAIAVNRENWTPKDTSYICEAHFLPEMFKHRGKVKKLKRNAVPTIFPDPNKIEKKPRVKRKKITEEEDHTFTTEYTDTADDDAILMDEIILPVDEIYSNNEHDESSPSVDSYRKYYTDVQLKYLEEEHVVKMSILSIENETADINNETAKIIYETKKIDHEMKKIDQVIKKIELEKIRRELEHLS